MGTISHTILTYCEQSVLHALIAALMIEALLRFWNIRALRLQMAFRLLVMAIALLGAPLMQLLIAGRSGPDFRNGYALFDSHRWYELSLVGPVTVKSLVLLLLLGTVGLFLWQEIRPMLLMHRWTRHTPTLGPLPGRSDTTLLDDTAPVIYTAGIRHPHIFVSTGLRTLLEADELQAALTHERIHMRKGDLPMGWLLFALRLALCFNPVVLIEFRRLINDNERLCDLLTVAELPDPLTYTSALVKVAKRQYQSTPVRYRTLWHAAGHTMEKRALASITKDRVRTLLDREVDIASPEMYLRYLVPVTLTIMTILVFVV